MQTRVLISAPSLIVDRNVSGISSVVREISRVLGREFEFQHLELGAEQGGGRLRRQLRSLAKAGAAIMRVLAGTYDVLHLNTALNPRSAVRDLAVAIAGRLRGKTVILHLHGGRFLQDRSSSAMNLVARALFANATRIVLLSEAEKALLAKDFAFSPLKVLALRNSVDIGAARSIVRPVRPARPLEAVFVGRFVPEKGMAALLGLVGRLSGVRVTFFGDGPLRPQVEAAVTTEDAFSYGGVFSPEAKLDVLSRFDVLLLPSLSGEGMPMAALEGMAIGTIPVCTPISASIGETITDGVNGFLVQPGSTEAILNLLNLLRDDPTLRTAMSDRVRRYAEAELDADRNFRPLADLYRSRLPRVARARVRTASL